MTQIFILKVFSLLSVSEITHKSEMHDTAVLSGTALYIHTLSETLGRLIQRRGQVQQVQANHLRAGCCIATGVGGL